jgi:hypothetical protein
MLNSLRHPFRQLFGIDVRCLAALRIAIALLLLTDLIFRWPFLVQCYTDDGFLPRDLVLEPDSWMSLQMLDGSPGFQVAHFVAAGCSSLLLLFGYQTKLALFFCWILTISLHARNGFLLDAGDDLLRSLMFWSLFLPLGARFSIDARGKNLTRQEIVVSPASAALLLQFACLYFFAGWFKTDQGWSDGTAIEMALGQTQWIRPAGHFLRQYPELLRYLTRAVVWFEILAPLLLFVPIRTRKIRMLVIPAFWLFQVSLASTFWLHIFPLITAAATIPFLSSIIWPFPTPASQQSTEKGEPSSRRAHPWQILWWSGLAALAFGVIAVQVANFGKSLLPTEERVASLIGWNAVWSMYSKTPQFSYRFSAEATLQDGGTVDLINSDVTGGERLTVQRFHQSYRARYFLETTSSARPQFPTRYLTYLVYLWNQDHSPERHVVRGRIVGTAQRIRSDEPAETTVLLDVGFSALPPDHG